MSTPINSSSTNANAPTVTDLMARLNTQANPGTGNDQAAFSRWLEKHAILPEQKAASNPSAQQVPQAGRPASTGQGAAAEQAMLRARHQSAIQQAKPQAAAPSKPGTTAQGAPQAHAADKAKAPAKSEANAAKPGAKAKVDTAKSSDATESTDSASASEGKDGSDEVSFQTAMGEGAAVVRELTPPPTIQAGDSAGMMAWLASLSQGHLAQGQNETAVASEGDEASQTAGSAVAGDAAGATPKAGVKSDGKASTLALDSRAWGGATGKAATALQADALLSPVGAKGEAKAESDPLAALGGALGVAPSFKQTLGEAAQAQRHESATLSAPLNSPDFSQALSDQVSMWVNTARTDGPMTAELHLNPAEMGPINIKISLDGQSAQVDFAAAAHETRQAIEASMSTLSDALGDIGLKMTGGDVSSQTAQQQFAQSEQARQGSMPTRSGRGSQGGLDDVPEDLSVRQVSVPRPGRLGGLDLYA